MEAAGFAAESAGAVVLVGGSEAALSFFFAASGPWLVPVPLGTALALALAFFVALASALAFRFNDGRTARAASFGGTRIAGVIVDDEEVVVADASRNAFSSFCSVASLSSALFLSILAMCWDAAMSAWSNPIVCAYEPICGSSWTPVLLPPIVMKDV